MIIVRDVVIHASVRKLEWLGAGIFLHLGVTLLLPSSLPFSAAYSAIWTYMSPTSWGILFVIYGLIRLIVLFLNGTQIKPSAEVRLVLSAIAFVIFAMWAWSIDTIGQTTLIEAVFKWLAFGELMNVWQASADVQKIRKGRKKSIG